MKCPRCRAESDAVARFCEGCGTRLEAVCPSCAAPITPGRKFCRSCGASLATEPPAPLSPETYTPKPLAEKILASVLIPLSMARRYHGAPLRAAGGVIVPVVSSIGSEPSLQHPRGSNRAHRERAERCKTERE
jgi:Double zinc ribbon